MSAGERLLLAMAVFFGAIAAVAAVLLWVGFALVLTGRTPFPCDCTFKYNPPIERQR